MKVFLLFFMTFGVVSSSFAQKCTSASGKARPGLLLGGFASVDEIKVLNKSSSFAIDSVILKFRLHLKNTGSVPIVFLQKEFSASRLEIYEDEQFDYFLAGTPKISSSSGVTQIDWERIKKMLDKSIPPSRRTRILKPGQVVGFETVVRIDFPRSPEEHTFALNGVNPSLDEIGKRSPLWARLILESWSTEPVVIDNKVDLSERCKFASGLQQRWQEFGYLWFEPVISAPIQLDLASLKAKR